MREPTCTSAHLPRAQVKRLQSSGSAIIDLSIDRSEEYLASCSQDGVVVVSRGRWRAAPALGACTQPRGPRPWPPQPQPPLPPLAPSQIYNLYTDKSTKYEFKRPARVGSPPRLWALAAAAWPAPRLAGTGTVRRGPVGAAAS